MKEGGRSISQAKRVFGELAGACRSAAAELEALIKVCPLPPPPERPNLECISYILYTV